MVTTIALKNIPDNIYRRLKPSAEANRRSLNSETIVCLGTVLSPARLSVSTRLARAQASRAALASSGIHAEDIDRFKWQERP